MNYETATNVELSIKLQSLIFPDVLWVTAPIYCEDWNATMPLAVKHGLDIELPEEWLGNVGTITKHMQYGTDVQVDFTNTDNPLRSIVICLIKVLESNQ